MGLSPQPAVDGDSKTKVTTRDQSTGFRDSKPKTEDPFKWLTNCQKKETLPH